MIFSPLVVIAVATCLPASASATPFFVTRQETANSSIVTDPHAAPSVPLNFTSPLADGGVGWKDAFAKASAIVGQMTVEEKVNISSGFPGPCAGNTGAVPRLSIPSLCMQDGPVGPRPVDLVSLFPAGVTTAATWDRNLIYERALAMGEEFRGKGIHQALSPVTGGPLGRSPLAGRGWEGWAPDVFLSSVASFLSVKGIQDAGVISTSKHYVAYEQESYRSYFNGAQTNETALYQQIDSVLDDKTFHELYLPSFAEAVRAGTGSVMCSYNSVNGTHACENDYTLNTILKGELGFQGNVVSDWGGTWSTQQSAAYGLDSSMPGTGFNGTFGSFFGEELVNLTASGAFSEERLADMAIRVLLPYFWLGQDSGFPATNFDESSLAENSTYAINEHVNVQGDHWKIILKIAEESATLLKNNAVNGRGLPLPNTSVPIRIGVFGNDAGFPDAGLTGCGTANDCFDSPADSSLPPLYSNPKPTSNGTVTVGGGSGAALPPYVVSPLEAITAKVRHTAATVDWDLSTDSIHYPYVDAVANVVDKAIVFVSAFQSEGYDRADLQLAHNGSQLINEVASYCSDTIVVIHSGQTVDMESWIDHENVTAVVFAYFPGQESGSAIASVLFGDISPSGKLPFTIGKALEDWPSPTIVTDDVFEPTASFDEGVFIDYKWFDAKNSTPRFPFGFGLSYSSFEYLNASVSSTPTNDSGYVQLTAEPFDGEGSLYDTLYTVTVTVENTGDVTAAEVAQLYLTWPSSVIDQPIRNLRGFEKDRFNAGESKTLSFPLRAKDLAVYDVVRAAWTIPSGEYTFSLGPDSRNLPVTVTLQV